ncbi:serine/threonine-protein kinase [Pseudarthrobacter sp. NIBRBAC000502770]|uniref:serine/threonine protein kinase n=1 Tax=Pseudarthrobacter sp. NIBRBAC000502770 TaxID=2590785 RepID=UPI00143CDFCE|nr:serine/threonine-protein kinase [Pseudarthrobacter sp. NIBRBAC000502770]
MGNEAALLKLALDELGITLIRDLKAGGQKTVHLVDHEGVSRVLKLVEIPAAEPNALERARREVALLAGTEHANVVKVVSPLTELGNPVRGAAWMEEFLDGGDLSDFLGGPWPAAEVREMGIAVSAGLSALHLQQVVHRDLSASNVRRLADGTYKVMDPGFAKHTLRTGLTVGGQPGTRGFMTPEHLQAYTGPTAASDVFAVGQLMYFAATGFAPYPYKGDDAEYITRLSAGHYTPLAQVRSDYPAELLAVIERALHPQPARRYRNGDALRVALEGTK